MDNHYNKLRKVIESRKQTAAQLQVENQRESKEFIASRIRKDLMTTAIGNISYIEREFGFLWGHGKARETLGETENVWRNIWEEMRNSILDEVNARIRRAHNELVRFEIKNVGYFYGSK
jgi:hypothetical protein